MSVVAIIGARQGSKGVHHKNILPVCGYSILGFAVRAALRAGNIDRVVVSTDSEQYAGIARAYDAEVPFLRPAEISGDGASDYDFIVHALDQLGEDPELLVHLRPTTVLRWPDVVSDAVDTMLLHPECTALRSVHEMSESAYKCFEIEGRALKCVGTGSLELDAANRPRQVFPKTYHANGYVDVLRPAYIRAHGCLHGNRVFPFITPPVVEIDTEYDLELVTHQARSSPLVKELFG